MQYLEVKNTYNPLWSNKTFLAKYEAYKKYALMNDDEECRLFENLKSDNYDKKSDAVIRLYRKTHYWILQEIVVYTEEEILMELAEQEAHIDIMSVILSAITDKNTQRDYKDFSLLLKVRTCRSVRDFFEGPKLVMYKLPKLF